MKSEDIPEERRLAFCAQIVTDKIRAIFEADTLSTVREPLCTLLKAWHTSGEIKASMNDVVQNGVGHISTVVVEVFPDEGLPVEDDEFQRLDLLKVALTSKNGLVENVRISSLFRSMEKRASQTKDVLGKRKHIVELVQGLVKDGAIASKKVADEIEAIHPYQIKFKCMFVVWLSHV